jgi:HK97 family phage major capsid protein
MTDLIIPTDADELEEMLNDAGQREKITADAEAFGEFITNYARSVLDTDKGIAQQIKDEAGKVFADMLRENGTDVPDALKGATPIIDSTTDPAAKRYRLNNPKAMGATLDGTFDSLAEFFQTAWFQNADRPEYAENREKIRNAFQSDVPAAGGFLVPEEFRSELLRVALETSIVRPRARTIPMSTARVAIPSIDSTSNATTVYGGIVGAWTEEAATMSATEATFGRTVLDAKKLTAYAEVPNELLADSAISFQALVDDIYPEALGFFEDVAFCTGSGAGEPQGFTNAAAEVAVAKETGQTADTIVWENIVKCYARMLPGSLGRAVWVANIDTFPELATMALSVGTGGSAIWLNNGAEGPPMTILGRPVIFTEKVATLGDVNDINLVDFGYYLIGDRQAMSVASSEHANFSSDVTAYRIIERVDGRPWLNSAITPQTGSNTLSPFVTVAARA